MVKQIETSSGFKCEIDAAVVDDMELFDAICDAERGNVLSVSVAIDKILGADKARLYDHIRDENGRVPTLKASTELIEIFKELGKK